MSPHTQISVLVSHTGNWHYTEEQQQFQPVRQMSHAVYR